LIQLAVLKGRSVVIIEAGEGNERDVKRTVNCTSWMAIWALLPRAEFKANEHARKARKELPVKCAFCAVLSKSKVEAEQNFEKVCRVASPG
jgi:hypothetical protein